MASDVRSQSRKGRRGPGRAGARGRSEEVRRGDTVIPNPKARLLDQLREVMRVKHYSLRTERSYRDRVRRFVKFHGMRGREDLECCGRAGWGCGVRWTIANSQSQIANSQGPIANSQGPRRRQSAERGTLSVEL